MQGILLVDKPKGWTSFDVVNFVRKIVANELGLKPKNVKVGHIGTLDPLATGLLVLLIGKKYTQKAVTMSKLDKLYEVEATLGEVSDSFDDETDKIAYSGYKPSESEVKLALRTFVGRIKQVPPAYSAIKINGQRAYKLSRDGRQPDIPTREVEIYDIYDTSYHYPKLKFKARVSSGTYIRSLVNDLGLSLKSGAYMSDLRRLSIDHFLLDEAVSVVDLTAEQIANKLLN